MMSSYIMIFSLFFKFFLTASNWIVKKNWDSALAIDQSEQSAVEPITRGKTEGVQLYQIVPKNQSVHDLVGRPVVHLSGLKHATGEAAYTDDVPPVQGELYGSFVLSSIAYGNILSIDAADALGVPGVVHFFDSSSIPSEKNIQGFIVDDEEVFASKEVLKLKKKLYCERTSMQS